MAWSGTSTPLATIVQESSARWGSRRYYNSDTDTWYRRYFVNTRTAEVGFTQVGAESRRDAILSGEDRNEYRDVQVQRVGASGQYWVVYVRTTATWELDPDLND